MPPPARVPVLLVAGPRGAGKTSLIRRWLADKPPAERWAVVVNDFGGQRLEACERAGVGVFELAAGCACCTASVVMRATLARVLRAGPWGRVLVELSAEAHPAAVIDALRAGALADAIEVEGTVAVLGAVSLAGAMPPAAPATSGAEGVGAETALAVPGAVGDMLAAADVVVLAGSRDAANGGAVAAGLRRAVGAGPMGARPVLGLDDDGPSWGRVRAALAAPGPPVAEDVAGSGRRWRRDGPAGRRLEWRWPPEARFDRVALRQWCAAVRARPEVAQACGVFRTEREWYRWTWSGGVESWVPTAWRRDSRVECTVLACDAATAAGAADAPHEVDADAPHEVDARVEEGLVAALAEP